MPSDSKRTLTLICRRCYRREAFRANELPEEFACPRCGETVRPGAENRLTPEGAVRMCLACGCGHLYVEKDFNAKLGCLIMVAAVALFLYFGKHQEALLFLLGAALADAILYFMVGKRTICYRCLAEHRGFEKNPKHEAYDLGVASRFSSDQENPNA